MTTEDKVRDEKLQYNINRKAEKSRENISIIIR